MEVQKPTWDEKHYQEIYEFMMATLGSVPWCSDVKCPVEWAKTKLPLVSMCVANEDYEGAQATKDAIMDFLNQFLSESEKITDQQTLKLPVKMS
ncbi:hypothetical protein [Mucilaginibacter sp. SP1R1]|uniref:hypothetical protein n=1 Tax=Mucilaginibacter sp. SP1R1 TaxID=2723091 RepID=UPI00161A7E69|nr:hypothetical protein [Mucilaginibacter sp. SP1R1]MBB6149455.1 hypothetical protein [Mucilaginibacter sp. SP1R1]